MLTIEEAIVHHYEKANELRQEAEYMLKDSIDYEPCLECANEHEQLAKWLEELKELRGDCEYENGKLLKRMLGGYVTYKVEYLLDHLAREVSLLESYRKWKEDKENNKCH